MEILDNGAYVVASKRSPVGKARPGGIFEHSRPDLTMAFMLRAVAESVLGDQLDYVDKVVLGCAFPEATQGFNPARVISKIAGLPDTISGKTVNVFCASGLQAAWDAHLQVLVGNAPVAMGCGMEFMSKVAMGGFTPRPSPVLEDIPFYQAMLKTADNVAQRYGISREDQDAFSMQSHMRALKAQQEGWFEEILATPAEKAILQEDQTYKRETHMVDKDDGIRPDTTLERLGKLRSAYVQGGTVTAGNSSQISDGVAATLFMRGSLVKALGITPLGRFVGFTIEGCKADEMGIGPSVAIPKLLEYVRIGDRKLTVNDIKAWLINEAFASQAIYCLRELGLWDRMNEVNIHGGAIALGHPLGCTGAKLTSEIFTNMRKLKSEFGMVSMCIGGGMGAAGLFQLYN